MRCKNMAYGRNVTIIVTTQLAHKMQVHMMQTQRQLMPMRCA